MATFGCFCCRCFPFWSLRHMGRKLYPLVLGSLFVLTKSGVELRDADWFSSAWSFYVFIKLWRILFVYDSEYNPQPLEEIWKVAQNEEKIRKACRGEKLQLFRKNNAKTTWFWRGFARPVHWSPVPNHPDNSLPRRIFEDRDAQKH